MQEHPIGTAIVTGASTGIGAVYAQKLALRGYDLIVVARNAERLEANAARLRHESGRQVEVLVADLAQHQEIESLARRITDDGRIRLLVNNAGLSSKGVLQDSAESIAAMLAVNVTAPTLLSQAAARAFAERGGGGVINISSVTAFAPEMFDGVYSGSKTYLLNLTISLAAKAATGLRFQAVLPGPTNTEMWARSGVPESVVPRSRIMGVEDLVAAALVGYDRGEVVTLPTVSDEAVWDAFETARRGLGPHLAAGEPAARYSSAAAPA